MIKTNGIKAGLIIMFIMTAGFLYSCRDKSDPVISLSSQTQETVESPAVWEKTNSEDTKEKENRKTNPKLSKEEMKETTEVEETVDGVLPVNTAGNSSGGTADDMHKCIYIHICGAVKKPDVYEVDEASRLVDVIKLAGGLTKAADRDYVNQAALVQDGQKVYIPTKEEVQKGLAVSAYEDSSNLFPVKENTSADTESAADSKLGKVNINKCSAEDLMTLPGIGEAKAAAILAYRQDHGGFKNIDEIKNISGIKDSVFNKINDKITVN